ncbi:ABC transporter substrate-binding protein [Marmoricola endophyticus]|uniref:ABC transporter substrate-binding protein n=2 Tax=Marmoricola endophyticus TaxID=2040280 RepID=A0A917BIH7_9ACTN|nr:ABC transporter substrate-binding protein [Marmoricola endophyticus]
MVRQRTLGVVFVVLLLVAVWFVYAIFNQKFTSFDKVSVKTDNVGLNLPEKADIKIRGKIIGQVLDMKSDGDDGAELTLGIQPDQIGDVPANVTAALLPKTLFGEKYVSLEVPDDPESTALATGDTITQTVLPTEVEELLNDLYPLLRTVQPAELNYTLNAIATALEGRGNAIGENLVTLGRYLKRINPEVPQLTEDLGKLSTVSDTYADVLPSLAQTLRNTVKTGNTLEGRETRLRQFLRSTTGLSNTAERVLSDNEDNLVRVGQVSRPTVDLLKTYSPEFPCLLKGLANIAPKLGTTFRGYTFHINVNLIPSQPRTYNAGDVPVYGAKNPPYCGTLPTPPYSSTNPLQKIPNFNDGTTDNDDLRSNPSRNRASTGYGDAKVVVGGNAQEKAVVRSLVAPAMDRPADEVGDVATLLFGPLARGSEVSYR